MPHKYNFEQIAEQYDIYEVASRLGIRIHNDRAKCPTCDTNDKHSLELIPETNTFRCWTAQPRKPEHKCLTGDNIGLMQHVRGYTGPYPAARELVGLFGDASAPHQTILPTSPQEPERRTAEKAQPAPTPKKERSFNPADFAAGLKFTDEVVALGISQDMAAKYRVGLHRGKLYIPICPADVEPQTWVEIADGKLKLPDKWLASNVVRLRRA